MKNKAKGAIVITAMCSILFSSAVLAANGPVAPGMKGTKGTPAKEPAPSTREVPPALTSGNYATFDKSLEDALKAANDIDPIFDEFVTPITDKFFDFVTEEAAKAAEESAETAADTEEPSAEETPDAEKISAEETPDAEETPVEKDEAEDLAEDPAEDVTAIEFDEEWPNSLPEINVPAPKPEVHVMDHLLAKYDIVTEYDDTNGVYAGVIDGRLRSGAMDTAMESRMRENWSDYYMFISKVRASKVYDLVSANCENYLIFRENTGEVVCKGKDITVDADFWGSDFGTYGDFWLTVKGKSYHINAIRSPKGIFAYTKYIYTHPDEEFVILYAENSQGTLARDGGIRGNISGYVDAELISKESISSPDMN